MNTIELIADLIDEQERHGMLVAPEWLAWCRRRVAEVTAGAPGVSPS
jgi:hypothetical protein